MPWSEEDAEKHKGGLSKEGRAKWASIANSSLDKCMRESKSEKDCAVQAIMKANSSVTESDIVDSKEYHISRQRDPQNYSSFSVYELNERIHVIHGHNHFKPSEIQALLFTKKHCTVEEALSWLKTVGFADVIEGGAGSGNFGHSGRPGERGGSGEGGDGGGSNAGTKVAGITAMVDTKARYSNPDGSYKPERAKLHTEIKERAYAGKTPVEHPTVVWMGGGPASGKSEFLETGNITETNLVNINPDLVKNGLPEYQAGLQAKNLSISGEVHEESSDVSRQMIKEVAERKYNSILDGTGDGDLEKMEGKINDFRKNGHKISAHYAAIDVNEGVRRARIRAENPKSDSYGRLPNEPYIRKTYKAVTRNFNEAIKRGWFDEATLWDTTDRGKPRKAATYKNGKMTVHDKKVWDMFQSQADKK